MSQVGESALDAAVAPGRVVVGHWQDERFALIRDTGPSQLGALLPAVKLLGDELFVPAHQGIRSGERGQRFEAFAANRKREGRETTAFGIGEAGALTTKFGVERTVFFQKISDDLLLMAIDPAGDHGDEDVQNHGNSWDGEYRRDHSTEYTVNPRDFNRVASADFFNTTGSHLCTI